MRIPPGQVRVDVLARRVMDRAAMYPQRRTVIGIAGPPGAGKSTLAALVRDAVNAAAGDVIAAVAPMDGFHLRNVVLDRLGIRHRKGAPDTFDAAGYAALLRRVVNVPGRIEWPAYDRELHDPTPGGIAIELATRIVITEGNYLLLGDEEWAPIASTLDESWYLAAEIDVIENRLYARQIKSGRAPDVAREHVVRSDLPNARRIQATAERADLVLQEQNCRYFVLADRASSDQIGA